MTRQHYKIIALVVLGIIAVVMLFLAAFRFFKPEGKSGLDSSEDVMVADDPASTLYVSKDGGETWHSVAEARFVAFHLLFAADGKKLFIGTQDNGMWEADGNSFTDVHRGNAGSMVPENATVFDVAMRTEESTALYAAARYEERGYLVSLEEITRRELFFAPLEDSPVRAVAVDPFSTRRIIIGAGSGFYESNDAGSTWKVVYRFRQNIADIVMHPYAPGWFFISTQRGEVFRTSDYGETWEDLTRGFSKQKGARENQRLHIDPISGSIYLTSNHGLLASWDDGVTWEDIPLIVPPDSLPIIGFAVHPTEHTALYISAANQLYKSVDGGETWRGKRFSEKGSITVIAIHPTNPDTVVIGFAE